MWRKAFCEIMFGGYLRHNNVAGETDLKFLHRNLLRFTFPADSRVEVHFRTQMQGGKIRSQESNKLKDGV